MSTLDDIRTREMRKLRVDTRGHAALRTRIERVDDPDYTDEWGGHTYYPQWTDITAMFSIETWKDDGEIFLQSLELPHACGNCDEFMSYQLIGDTAVAKTECQYGEGITTVIEIDVLSGRLICDDDLRDAPTFDWDPPSSESFDPRAPRLASYNSALGQAQVVEKCAEVGLAYAPVGNSSPSLYEVGQGKYVVANPEYDEETDDVKNFEGKPVAWFCTDLWACSMADYDTFLAAGGTPVEEDDQNGTRSVIDVPPGRYRMTYHGGEKFFDNHSASDTIYAEFEKIA
jgi:hypothetical protein